MGPGNIIMRKLEPPMLLTRVVIILVVVLGSTVVAEQEIQITGKIKGRDGKPVPQAAVSVHPLEVTVNSDANGDYILSLPPGTYTVIVEAAGYEVRGESVSTSGKSLSLDFVLQPRHLQFEELVIASAESSGTSPSSPASTVDPQKQ